MQLLTLNRLVHSQHYSEQDISPYFWPNGKMPVREDWKHLAQHGFQDFKLKVGGLVENPVELSLADIEKLGRSNTSRCITAFRAGVALPNGAAFRCATLIDLVRPKPEAKVVAFFSFGEALYGGAYYDTQSLENVLKPECLLALRDEWPATSGRLWRSAAAASRKSAWLQDGQVDRAHRVYPVRETVGQRRRRQERRRRYFDLFLISERRAPVRLPRLYERIIVNTILKRVVAFTACGLSAGSRTTSPGFTAMGLPATVISASPSTACTSASNGEVCSLNPCPSSNAKIVTFPFRA